MGGKPRVKEALYRIRNPEDAYQRFRTLLCGACEEEMAKHQEVMMVLCVRGHPHVLVGAHVVSVGTVDRVSMNIRDIARVALVDNVRHVWLAHTHPSGDAEPSPVDAAVSWHACHVLQALNVSVVDALVLGKDNFCSMRRHLGGPQPEKGDLLTALRHHFIAHGAEVFRKH